MPYAEELNDVPRLPNPQGKMVNPDHTPTQEWFTYFVKTQEFMRRVKAALDELEPP